ncbi:MAG: hypothetical protein AAB649_00535, partial [Patescibacteria group bacterium]
KKEVKKVGFGSVLSLLGYIFGALFVVWGIVGLFKSFIGGLLIIIGGLLLIPKFNTFIREKYKIELTNGLRIAGFFILFVIGGWIVALAPSHSSGSSVADTADNSGTPLIVMNIKSVFPSPDDIPTSLKIGAIGDLPPNVDYVPPSDANYVLGKHSAGATQTYYTPTALGFGGEKITLDAYLFDSPESARVGYDALINEIKAGRGYNEENSGSKNCFAYSNNSDLVIRWDAACLWGNIYLKVRGYSGGYSFDPVHPKEIIGLVDKQLEKLG